MRNATRILVTTLAILFVLSCVAFGDEDVLDAARDYPHAGISVAMPKGFEPQPLGGLYDVVRAVKKKDDRVLQGVTVSAFVVGSPEITADQYADAMFGELENNLTFRQLTLRSRTPITVAGIQGTARLIGYRFRGADTLAAQVFFIRRLEETGTRICYVLTVEAEAEFKDKLLGLLAKEIGSITMIPLQPVMDLGIGELGKPLPDYKRSYSLRIPAGWCATGTSHGILVARPDYLAGGEVTVSIQVLVEPVPDGASAMDLLGERERKAQQAAADRGWPFKPFDVSPARLGGLDAAQSVFHWVKLSPPLDPEFAPSRRATSAPATAPTTAQTGTAPAKTAGCEEFIVHRMACPPAGHALAGRSYSLVLSCRGGKRAAAMAMMEKIASGFEFLQPTTAPAQTTETKK